MLLITPVILVLLLASVCPAAEDAMLKHTLFLAHFNQSVQPDIARGGGAVASGSLGINADAGFTFGKSGGAVRGLDLRSSKGHISFPVKNNFNPRQGTLQFFFRPDWPVNGSNFARIFSLVFDPARRSQMEQEGCTGFLLVKRAGSWILEFRNMYTWKDSKINAEIKPWKAGEWHHIALTWKEGGEKVIYVDGQKTVSGKYHRLKKTPKEFILGSPNWASSVSACYDEVRILDIPLTPEQIAGDYQSLKSGQEFSPAGTSAALDAAGAPEEEDGMLSHTLFLAHFNKSVKPEIALGGSEAVSAENLEINTHSGYYFKDSPSPRGGLDLRTTKSHISFPVSGNFDPRQGTIQFFLYPHWPANGSNFARIFSLVFDPARRSQMEQEGCTGFLLVKQGGKWLLEFRNMYTWKDSKIVTDISTWSPEEWHHLTLTWKEGGEKILYIDGQKAVSGKYHKLKKEPREFILGSPNWASSVSACYDEFRILDIPITPEQVAADYRKLTRGREFAPVNAKSHLDYLQKDYLPAVPAEKTAAEAQIYTGDRYDIFYSPRPVRITGDGQDPLWKKIKSVPPFRTWKGQQPKAASSFKAVYDDKNLYILAQFDEPRMDRLRANRDQRDIAIYSDDCLEFVLDHGNSPETTIHCAVNVIGGIYDAVKSDARFNIKGMQVKGKRQASGWSVECVLPFDGMKASVPAPGEFWGFRVNRERYAETETSSWPVISKGGLGSRNFLAKMQFRGNLDAGEELQASMEKKPLLLGLNTLDFSLKNCSAKILNARLDAYAIYPDAKRRIQSLSVSGLAGGASRTLKLELPIQSPTVRQVAVEIKAGSRILWRDSLQSSFGTLAISPEELQKKLNAMAVDVAGWRCLGENPYQAFNRNYEKISTILGNFQKQIRDAVSRKTTLPAGVYEKLLPHFHGFSQWLDARYLRVVPGNLWMNGSPENITDSLPCRELKFRQLGNEWSYQALDITGILPRGGTTWRIAVDDFYPPSGRNRISRSRMTVYAMPFVRTPSGSLVTDPLIESPGNTFYLKAGQTSRMLLALHSRDVPPGRYRGRITLKPLDITAYPRELWPKIDITWEVLPVAMPATCDWPMDSYFWNGGAGTPVENETPILSVLESHHVNWIMTNRVRYDQGMQPNGYDWSPRVKNDTRKRGDYWNPANITANDEFLKEALRQKMRLVFAWNICRNADWVSAMSSHLQKLGYRPGDYMFTGICDEFNEGVFRQYLPFHREVLKRNPEVRWMASLVPFSGMSQAQFEEMVTFLQTPIIHNSMLWPQGTAIEKSTRRWMAKRPDLKPWIYQCGLNMADRPILGYYRLFPMQGYLSRVQGVAMWVLTQMSSRSYRTPDAHFDCKDPESTWQDGIFWWHPSRIIIPTKRFLAFSEGLEDVAMIHILKKQIAQARQNGRTVSPEEEELVSYQHLLNLYKTDSQKKLDLWHNQVFNAISRLIAK